MTNYSMCNRASARANRLEIQPWRNDPSHVPESDFPHANSYSHHKVSMDLDCSTSPHLLISISSLSFIFFGATRASLAGDHVAEPLTDISNSHVQWKASHVTRDGERRNCRAVELTHLHSIHSCTTYRNGVSAALSISDWPSSFLSRPDDVAEIWDGSGL
jgi:hypothetical protein